MIFLDTESVGFSGPLLLIQTKRIGESPKVHEVFKVPVSETLELIDSILHVESLCIFNAAHDMFVLTKWYTILNKVQDTSKLPDPKEIRAIEEGLDYSRIACLKANRIFDLYVILKQTLFSFAVGRQKRPIEIRLIPITAAKTLKNILEKFAVQLPSILFEKFKNKLPGEYWEVSPSKQEGFVDFKLNFNPSLGLKSIIKFLYPDEQIQRIEISKYNQPREEDREFQPWNNDWPRLLQTHLKYWDTPQAQSYAKNDVLYLERLYELLVSKNLWPKEVHIDSDLAGHIGTSRARGFNLDMSGIQKQLLEAEQSLEDIPDASPHAALVWLREVAPPDLLWLVQNTDTKKTLIPLSKMGDYPELALRAEKLITQRSAKKKIELLKKLKSVGRYHPDFEVSGTLSNRMSGRGGINPQGINREKSFRELFLLSENSEHLSGGDFSSQEVTILEAVVKDPDLTLLISENPKRIHEFMAECLFAQILTPIKCVDGKNGIKVEWNEDFKANQDEYYQAKQTVYAYIYGAQMATLVKTARISIEQTQRGIDRFIEKLPGLRNFADKIREEFCSMKQPGGLGSPVEWHDPQDQCTSIFGDSRSYILDNRICKFLFNLAANPPEDLKRLSGRVMRRDREQSVTGATQSSLYGTAFGIQAENLRTAGNNYIQSPGAKVTKILQHALWALQPPGISKFVVQLYNVHDELLCVNTCPAKVAKLVKKTIVALRAYIPLLNIDWKQELGSWAEVKD